MLRGCGACCAYYSREWILAGNQISQFEHDPARPLARAFALHLLYRDAGFAMMPG